MIILIGASATGKTEVGKLLNNKYNIKKVITYTTREKRINEVDDVDYHFITKEKFKELAKENFFFEYVNYNDNYYGTSYESLKEDTYLIVEPNGFHKYYNSDVNFTSFYLETSKEIRLNRMIIRGDNIESAKKRIEIDDYVFNDETKSKVDYVINTDFITLDKVCEIIIEDYKNNISHK